jgi:hypothetical protein
VVTSYLSPRIVYVGDRAALVIPLENSPPGEVLFAGEPPSLPDLVIHRIALESRGEGGRLLIDFTAYAPGLLELPPFEIGGLSFSGLRIEIASILGSGEEAAVFSPPAAPLAIPGTGFLIYGTVTGMILLILGALWAFLWAPRRMKGWLKKIRQRRLVFSLAGMERRVRRELVRGNTSAAQREERLNFLTGEFRSFLGLFTGENCRAMTAGEFSRFSPPGEWLPGDSSLGADFLGNFFRRCDNIRFSGAGISTGELLEILENLRRFIAALNAALLEGRPAGVSAVPALPGGAL